MPAERLGELMAHEFPPDVEEQLEERVASGRYPSKADVIREALLALKRQDDDLMAVRDAIADMEAGDRGQPFDEFVEEFRRKHNIAKEA
jgi:putative addiction module CopG family antidote